MSEIHIADAPAIDGLHFRTYEGEGDIPAIVRVMNAAGAANSSGEYWTASQLRNWVSNPSSTDPGEDLVLTFAGDELAAVSLLTWEDSNEGPRHYQTFGFVEPRWRRHGLGTALLPRQEARLREIAGGHQLAVPPVYATWLDGPDMGATALITGRGYQLMRTYHHMVRPDMDDIELTPVAPGIEIRPATRAELPVVWDGMAEAFRDHFGAMDDSPSAFKRWSQSPRMDLELLLVAFDDDEVAAGVQGAIVNEENEARGYSRGWTDPIFTRRPWRRRGLASAVLGRTLAALRDRGMTSAQLGVDTQNPNDALTLYQRHRFESTHTETEWHKPLEVGHD